ncbi:hypothetical protein Tco_0167400, partial [Tanacetum coccineum]
KRANLLVKGIMIEGEWVDDPIRVKDEFRNHFADRFNKGRSNADYTRLISKSIFITNFPDVTYLRSLHTLGTIQSMGTGCGRLYRIGVSSPPKPLASSPALVLDELCMVCKRSDNLSWGGGQTSAFNQMDGCTKDYGEEHLGSNGGHECSDELLSLNNSRPSVPSEWGVYGDVGGWSRERNKVEREMEEWSDDGWSTFLAQGACSFNSLFF